METRSKPWLVAAAFGVLYLVWGSTYLVIRILVQPEPPMIPPLLLAGSRNIVAGIILYAFARSRGTTAPASAWPLAIVVGFLMLGLGNGGVTFAETRVPSGLVALLVAAVPLWLGIWESIIPPRRRPGAKTIVGIVLGLVAVAWLAGEDAGWSGPVDPVYVGAVLVGSAGWALGSILGRGSGVDVFLMSGMQMFAGGIILTLGGALRGEFTDFHIAAITPVGWAYWLYLTIAGSILAFTAYVWLLRHVRAPLVGTYAFVNPVVAVTLGAIILAEPLTPRIFVAGAGVVAAVALVLWDKARRAAPPPAPAEG